MFRRYVFVLEAVGLLVGQVNNTLDARRDKNLARPAAEDIGLRAGAQRCIDALDKHLGLQCHVEMTPEMIRSWCESGKRELERSACASVQTALEIESHLEARLAILNAVAARLYDRWTAGLKE